MGRNRGDRGYDTFKERDMDREPDRPAKGQYQEWASEVCSLLMQDPRDLFKQAIDWNVSQAGKPSAEVLTVRAPDEFTLGDREKFLAWLRGDESMETWEQGDSPKKYAKFLLDEWALFGPWGE